jgi:hypothetical protein
MTTEMSLNNQTLEDPNQKLKQENESKTLEFNGQIQTLNKENEKFKNQILKSETQIEEQEKKLNEQQNRLTFLEEELNRRQEELNEKNSTLAARTSASECSSFDIKLEDPNQKLKQENEELTKQVVELTKQNRELNERNSTLAARTSGSECSSFDIKPKDYLFELVNEKQFIISKESLNGNICYSYFFDYEKETVRLMCEIQNNFGCSAGGDFLESLEFFRMNFWDEMFTFTGYYRAYKYSLINVLFFLMHIYCFELFFIMRENYESYLFKIKKCIYRVFAMLKEYLNFAVERKSELTMIKNKFENYKNSSSKIFFEDFKSIMEKNIKLDMPDTPPKETLLSKILFRILYLSSSENSDFMQIQFPI